MALLNAARDEECRVTDCPKTHDRPTRGRAPELVAQIKFTEWTADGQAAGIRFIGLRDGQKAEGTCNAKTSLGTRF